jgi:hypothetical protein
MLSFLVPALIALATLTWYGGILFLLYKIWQELKAIRIGQRT